MHEPIVYFVLFAISVPKSVNSLLAVAFLPKTVSFPEPVLSVRETADCPSSASLLSFFFLLFFGLIC